MCDELAPKLGSVWMERNGRLCVVMHILTTTDDAGVVRKVEFESLRAVMGQEVHSIDGMTTVRMGIDRYNKSCIEKHIGKQVTA